MSFSPRHPLVFCEPFYKALVTNRASHTFIFSTGATQCQYAAPSVSAWAAVALAVTSPTLPIPPSSGFTAIGLGVLSSLTIVIRVRVNVVGLSHMLTLPHIRTCLFPKSTGVVYPTGTPLDLPLSFHRLTIHSPWLSVRFSITSGRAGTLCRMTCTCLRFLRDCWQERALVVCSRHCSLLLVWMAANTGLL